MASKMAPRGLPKPLRDPKKTPKMTQRPPRETPKRALKVSNWAPRGLQNDLKRPLRGSQSESPAKALMDAPVVIVVGVVSGC